MVVSISTLNHWILSLSYPIYCCSICMTIDSPDMVCMVCGNIYSYEIISQHLNSKHDLTYQYSTKKEHIRNMTSHQTGCQCFSHCGYCGVTNRKLVHIPVNYVNINLNICYSCVKEHLLDAFEIPNSLYTGEEHDKIDWLNYQHDDEFYQRAHYIS